MPDPLMPNISKDTPQRIAYILYYRQGNNPHPQSKQFYLPGSVEMRDVIKRSQMHCERMGLRFIIVKPFWTDLDQEEKIKMAGAEL